MLQAGKPFPNFQLPDQNEQLHSLQDFAGKWLVVYFYPRDNTSGCTLEAKSFTDLAGQFADHGAVIVGVSPDSVKSHCGFIAKHGLGITLLSDPERALLEAAGAWQKKKLYGKEHMGVVRSTALVDPQGVVREVWTKVKAAGHAEEVLARLRQLHGKT